MTGAINLIPLGVVHTDAYDYCRKPLMELIEAEWRAGRLTLWGYERGANWNKSKPIPYPDNLDLKLDWVAGPGRTDGSNPRFPGLAYYCDVSAFHHSNPNAYFWTELRIANADLDRLRAEVRETGLKPAGASSPQDPPQPVEERPDADKSVRAVQASDSIPISAGKKNGDAIRRRSAYRGALEAWMASQDLAILRKMEPAAIAREFKTHCEQKLPELISLLPKRLRSMEQLIETTIERRRAKVVRLRSANKSQ